MVNYYYQCEYIFNPSILYSGDYVTSVSSVVLFLIAMLEEAYQDYIELTLRINKCY